MIELLSSVQYVFGTAGAIMLYDRQDKGLFDNEEYRKCNEEIANSKNYEVFNKLFDELKIDEFINGFELIESKHLRKESILK